jgi:catechol 2,3-dioxygenase-like lactoylglutathione lyase family enzyme
MRLSALRLFVDDLDRAGEFYGGLLGLPLRHDGAPEGWLVFDGGGARVIVERVAPDAPAADRALVGRFLGVSFEVDDIEVAYRRLAAAGVRFPARPERQAWGGTLATCCDPDGNRLQLVQYG